MKKPQGIIVGTGRAGTELHFGALTVAGADIVAFVDSDPDKVRQTAKRLRVPGAYTSLDEAIEKHSPDFVSICAPVSAHANLALLALRRGVHVLLEKPMVSNREEADRLASEVQKSGKTVTVVHNHKFYPGIQQALSLISSGAIGTVTHVHREMSFRADTVRMMEEGHWAHAIPGGRLFEANPHNLYLLYNFVGPFKLDHIQGRKVSDRWPHASIDEFTAIGSTDSATITLHMSMHAIDGPEWKNYEPIFFVITGTRGVLVGNYQNAIRLDEGLHPGTVYGRLPSMLITSLKNHFHGSTPLFDVTGAPISVGIGSGHALYMKEYIAFLRGERPDAPVSWEEAYFTETMNEEMGNRLSK